MWQHPPFRPWLHWGLLMSTCPDLPGNVPLPGSESATSHTCSLPEETTYQGRAHLPGKPLASLSSSFLWSLQPPSPPAAIGADHLWLHLCSSNSCHSQYDVISVRTDMHTSPEDMSDLAHRMDQLGVRGPCLPVFPPRRCQMCHYLISKLRGLPSPEDKHAPFLPRSLCGDMMAPHSCPCSMYGGASADHRGPHPRQAPGPGIQDRRQRPLCCEQSAMHPAQGQRQNPRWHI